MGEKEVSRVGERVNPISVRSKRRITDALLELMQSAPFSRITIKDIVDRAGLTRQTFYHNFDSKEEALSYRLDEYIEGFLRSLSEQTVRSWEDLIGIFFGYWLEQAAFLQLLLRNDLMFLLARRLEVRFEPVRAERTGLTGLTGLTDAEAKLWFSFLSGALAATLSSWLKEPNGFSSRSLAKATLTMLNGTMLNRTNLSNPEKAGQVAALLVSGLQNRTTESK